eukprot:3824874-Prymnesium_polylepis.1
MWQDRSAVYQWSAGNSSAHVADLRVLSITDANLLAGSWIDVSFTYSNGAVTVRAGSLTLHHAVTLPPIDPATASTWRVIIGGATGVAHTSHYIDDVQ